MVVMTKRSKPSEAPPPTVDRKKRNVVFISLDEITEAALQKFITAQRIPPERSSVGFTALVEFLRREGYLD